MRRADTSSLRKLWRRGRWLLGAAALLLVLLLLPVAYVELGCRGESAPDTYQPLIEASSRRREANTYLTYPEWHIVYAYDGLAETLKRDDEHAFDYVESVRGFWRASCALMEVADAHGGADFDTRSMIHTIGVSFTVEMAIKAAYEETMGRVTAWIRGGEKTPQDREIARMASDYSAFLRQTPWYAYDFRREAGRLWNTPSDGVIRGWERRIGIGAEFLGKAAYARLLAGAVAATAAAPLTIRSVVTGLDRATLSGIENVRIISEGRDGIEIETPRYDLFTRILVIIARQGGTIAEIAGNDDIMVTLAVPAGSDPAVAPAHRLLRLHRTGFEGDRMLVDVKVRDLATLLNAHPPGDPGIEHVFDY